MAGTTHRRDGDDAPEPPRLRQLRSLVTLLTATLIVGVIAIVVLLAIRLVGIAEPPPVPTLPQQVRLPAGERSLAVTFGTGWVAVVTVDPGGTERIRVLDAASGAERGALAITAAPDAPNNARRE